MDVVLRRKDVAMALVGPVAVSSIVGRLTVDGVQAMSDAAAEHRAKYAGRELSLTVAKDGIPMPDDETRAFIKQMNARSESAQVSVIVIEGNPFWAAAVRTLLASLAFVSKTAPTGALSIAEALRKLNAHAKGDPALADLAQVERDIIAFRDAHWKG
jgi:hypothetical protein